MEIKAKLNYLRIAPRKVRSVTDLIKDMEIKEAETQLRFMPKRAAEPLLKLLNSAIANARNNFKLEKDSLYIKEINVNEGSPYKRWRPVSRGRTFPIMRRTSHVNLILGVREGITEKEIKKVKPEEPREVKEKPKAIIEKPKVRAPKEIRGERRFKGLVKKIFRRKSF